MALNSNSHSLEVSLMLLSVPEGCFFLKKDRSFTVIICQIFLGIVWSCPSLIHICILIIEEGYDIPLLQVCTLSITLVCSVTPTEGTRKTE